MSDVIGLDLLGTNPEWWERALCQEADPEAFFPEQGESPEPALRICRRCEPWVRDSCLADTLALESKLPGRLFGVRGGMTAREREVLLGKRKPKAEPVGGER